MKKCEANTTENAIGTPTLKDAGLFYSLTVVAILVTSLIFSLVISTIGGGEEYKSQDWYLLLNYTVSGIPLFFALAVGLKVRRLSLKQNFGEVKVGVKFVVATVLVWFGLFFGLSEANNFLIELFKKIGYVPTNVGLPSFSVWRFILLVIGVCILPAVFEELIFRCFILKGLQSLGSVKAVLISAGLFSLYHMSPEKTLYQFIAGCLFAVIALRTKSVLPTIFIHFFNNLFVILNFYFLNLDFTKVVKTVLMISGLIALTVGVTMFLYKAEIKKSTEKSGKFWFYALAGVIGASVMWISGFASW